VLLTGFYCVIVKGGVLALGNQWEAILRRTTDRNMVKEMDKWIIDSPGLCFGFLIRDLAQKLHNLHAAFLHCAEPHREI
jgi:hypothetical protein